MQDDLYPFNEIDDLSTPANMYSPAVTRPEPDSLESVQAWNQKQREGLQALKDSWHRLPVETRKQVIEDKLRCPVCHGGFLYCDERSETRLADTSTKAYYSKCPCFGARLFATEFKSRVLPGYQFVAKVFEPSPKARASMDFQRKVIDLLKSKPRASFAFFGAAGCGKTCCSMWLFTKALESFCIQDTRLPLRGSASAIVRQHHAWVTADSDDVPEPVITVSKAERSPVFIAEMEKIGTMTEYKYEVLFGIMDSLYEKRPRTQLVLDSNLSIDGFEEYFTDKIGRRVAELCYRIDYFNETILEPTDETMR